MTMGATGFTRLAGRAGVLATFFAVIFYFELLASDGWEPHAGTVLSAFALVACLLVFTVGLIARHRGLWWVRPVVYLFATSLALLLLGAMWSPFAVLAFWIAGLTYGGVLLGVFLQGDLPRPAAFLVLLASMSDRDLGGFLTFLTGLAGFIGYTWLALAMAREPVADTVRPDVVPIAA
jgi:hypothetical protein